MSEIIPTYKLNMLTKSELESSGFFFSSQRSERPKVRIDIPYRSGYYKIAVCLRGRAEVKVNLETYSVEPNSLVIMSPHIIKQWTFVSGDYASADIFFTEKFMTTGNDLNLNKFSFFETNSRHVLQMSAVEAQDLSASLRFIQQKDSSPGIYRDDIVRNLIISLLYETAAICDERMTATAVGSVLTKKKMVAAEFKKLVSIHCSTERHLKFYAAKFSITPKHLTETVKEATGKTAGEWIAEAIVLEAKVLLRDAFLTIAQISDNLHFPDQSTFGKFFKKQTKLSPAAYRLTI